MKSFSLSTSNNNLLDITFEIFINFLRFFNKLYIKVEDLSDFLIRFFIYENLNDSGISDTKKSNF